MIAHRESVSVIRIAFDSDSRHLASSLIRESLWSPATTYKVSFRACHDHATHSDARLCPRRCCPSHASGICGHLCNLCARCWFGRSSIKEELVHSFHRWAQIESLHQCAMSGYGTIGIDARSGIQCSLVTAGYGLPIRENTLLAAAWLSNVWTRARHVTFCVFRA